MPSGLISPPPTNPIQFSWVIPNGRVGYGIPFPVVGSPYTAVGITVGPTTIPAVGASVTIGLTQPYTGAVDKIVRIGNKTYKLSPLPQPAPVNTVVAVNVDDPPTTVHAAPCSLIAYGPFQGGKELPPGRMGAYVMGRNAVSLPDGKRFIIGDIVGGIAGTEAFNYRDSVLKVTENDFIVGGGFFNVPGSIGDIRFMKAVALMDASLGQGALQIGTPNAVFSVNVPVDRVTWAAITNPVLTQSIITNGGLGQNSTVNANSDLLMRSTDGIRSMILARREFATWGNVPISDEVAETLNSDDSALLAYGSAIVFDNRLLMTASPSINARGIAHSKLVALNFDPVSSLRGKSESVYDGIWTDIEVFQLFRGQFSSIERAFAICLGQTGIQIFEILTDNAMLLSEDTDFVTYVMESASIFSTLPNKTIFDLCRLQDGEIYLRDLVGTVIVVVEYRPDFSTLWIPWSSFSIAAGITPEYRGPMGLGEPSPVPCGTNTNRPTREAFHFQVRLTITVQGTGGCKFMGLRAKAVTIPREQFAPVAGCIPATTPTRFRPVNPPLPVPVQPLDPIEPAPSFYNAALTLSCAPPCTGTPVIIAAGIYGPSASQEDADALALAAAQVALVCTLPEDYYATAGTEYEPFDSGAVPSDVGGTLGYGRLVIFNNTAQAVKRLKIDFYAGTLQTLTGNYDAFNALPAGQWKRFPWEIWYRPALPDTYPRINWTVTATMFDDSVIVLDPQSYTVHGQVNTYWINGLPGCPAPVQS